MKERDGASSGLEATVLGDSLERRSAGERDLTGSRLRHFEVKQVIGRGAMGTVYLGHDTSLDRPVALKVLAPDIAHDPAMKERFVLEAQAQARLVHPNVVQMYFVGEAEGGIQFFAMEYVEGPALDAVLQKGSPVAWPEALGYAVSAARGLKAAQEAGFIHRDVKPSNLLLDGKGGVKIFDFGLVKSMKGDSSLTQAGSIVGSPYYMAPEQGRSESVDHRSDMYSLGCTLYHLLCARPPFDAPSPVGVISMHVTERAAPVRTVAPAVPAALERVVEKLMAKAPSDRYVGYNELLSALEMARPGTRRSFSGFWSRAGALGLDVVPLALLALFIGPWILPLAALYFVGSHAVFGATLGKRLWRLRVVDLAGQRIGWRAAAIRFLVFVWAPAFAVAVGGVIYVQYRHHPITVRLDSLSRGTLWGPLAYLGVTQAAVVGYLAGFLVAAFHPKHQALHDLVAKTTVVREPR
jgi:uncharacterized RDD family membrane protein YckC/predicted Ser/Thr protein kinase